ncbi:MAG TPA: 50S ribosomal protein L11 methyltransferase [Thermoanaerobaculia bacterium]|nr:50S ribosomal protein L11 methyltransferase [Thermoanaerobaculia bacterium]
MGNRPEGTTAAAVRIEVPAALAASFEESGFFEGMGDVTFSASLAPDGRLFVWVEAHDLTAALARLEELGVRGLSTFEEKTTDWVAESAGLRKAVLVERYLLDPHDDQLATPEPPGIRRLFLPAVRAFGTGSHESTRLALRVLLSEDLRGARVLDVGCGTGTLAFVAALEGARHVVAFDVDPHAAFATREQARANGIPRLHTFAGPPAALRDEVRFDIIVANMIHEEIAPLLPLFRTRLLSNGLLLCSGQLAERRGEWDDLLQRSGFHSVRSIAENEWFGSAWISSNG